MASYTSLVYSIGGRSQLLGAAGWHQDTFIFGAEDGWWDLLFQTLLNRFFEGLLMCLPMTFFWLLPGGTLFPTCSFDSNDPKLRTDPIRSLCSTIKSKKNMDRDAAATQ